MGQSARPASTVIRGASPSSQRPGDAMPRRPRPGTRAGRRAPAGRPPSVAVVMTGVAPSRPATSPGQLVGSRRRGLRTARWRASPPRRPQRRPGRSPCRREAAPMALTAIPVAPISTRPSTCCHLGADRLEPGSRPGARREAGGRWPPRPPVTEQDRHSLHARRTPADEHRVLGGQAHRLVGADRDAPADGDLDQMAEPLGRRGRPVEGGEGGHDRATRAQAAQRGVEYLEPAAADENPIRVRESRKTAGATPSTTVAAEPARLRRRRAASSLLCSTAKICRPGDRRAHSAETEPDPAPTSHMTPAAGMPKLAQSHGPHLGLGDHPLRGARSGRRAGPTTTRAHRTAPGPRRTDHRQRVEGPSASSAGSPCPDDPRRLAELG